jgi:hypothetical protein
MVSDVRRIAHDGVERRARHGFRPEREEVAGDVVPGSNQAFSVAHALAVDVHTEDLVSRALGAELSKDLDGRTQEGAAAIAWIEDRASPVS